VTLIYFGVFRVARSATGLLSVTNPSLTALIKQQKEREIVGFCCVLPSCKKLLGFWEEAKQVKAMVEAPRFASRKRETNRIAEEKNDYIEHTMST